MKYRLHLSYLLIAIFCLLLGGCSGSSSASRKEHSGPPRDSNSLRDSSDCCEAVIRYRAA